MKPAYLTLKEEENTSLREKRLLRKRKNIKVQKKMKEN